MDFESVYQRYFKAVFLFLRSISASEDMAEEITQETFTRALKAIDTFDGRKDIRAWLFTIARNTYYTHCKRQKIYVEEDIENIYNILKGNHTFKKNVFFEKELFHIYNDIENKEDVIHRLCESLYYKGYVDQQYEGLVLAREQIAPTAYGSMFAIPHAVKKAGFATRIAVALLDKPIDWNQQKVRLVFLFCLTKERNEEFDLLFEKLVGLLDESKKVRELLKCKKYEEFLELFLSE